MEINWISWDYYYETYLANEPYAWKLYLKSVIEKFLLEYPTVEDWLNTETSNKISFKNHGYSEIHYIACWAWEIELYKKKEFYPALLEYFQDKRHDVSNVPFWLAKKVGLLTEEDTYVIKEYSRGLLKAISLHCLFISKPLKNFSDKDVTRFPELFRKPYSAKALQNIRLNLGYTNTIVKRKARNSRWDKLYLNPSYGEMIKEFYEYMIRCDAKKKYIITMGTVLTALFQYLEDHGLDNCSDFKDSDFKALTDYLLETKQESSVLGYIAMLKKFFAWGLGESSFFPLKLEYPNTYWKELLYKAKKKRKKSDGRAFSEPDMAQEIVNILLKYTPTNEIEILCKSFWLILASCPARLSYILNIGAEDTIQPLPNEPDTYGIYSPLADKAGNRYGQFPILDKIGLEEIIKLQERTKKLELAPITNPENKRTYIHLFQLTNYPWILDKNMIRIFFEEKVKTELIKRYPDFSDLRASAHSFRHHLLTHIAYITGDIRIVQTASGHKDELMTREYLRSKVSRDALLFRVMRKFEAKEITGKFYLRLVELLSCEDTPVDLMLNALTTEMQMDEFINRFGKPLEMGYCFNNRDCSNWLKCWNCINFLMTKSEISAAVKALAHQMIYLKDLQKNCSDFTYSNPIVQRQVRTISIIVKRLTELDLTEEEIVKMVNNYLHQRSIEEGVI